jgi:hypothetical protein
MTNPTQSLETAKVVATIQITKDDQGFNADFTASGVLSVDDKMMTREVLVKLCEELNVQVAEGLVEIAFQKGFRAAEAEMD